jgi:hypothetical protein
MTLQSVLLIILPVFTPLVGSSVAAILAQDKWPVWANDTIAWVILLAFAGGDMYANSQFAGGWVIIVADGVQVVAFLSSGWLVKLAPWLIWLSWLQANLFNLVPLFEKLDRPAPTGTQTVTTSAVPASVPTPIVLPITSAQPDKPQGA